MIPPMQQEILRGLSEVCDLSPGIRFGQMLAQLEFLAEDMSERNLPNIEDEALFRVIEKLRFDLAQRQFKSLEAAG